MKIISCNDAVKRIFELIDEGIKEEKRKDELDKHLDVCRECCNRLEFEQLLKEKIQDLESKQKAPKRLEKRVHKILDKF